MNLRSHCLKLNITYVRMSKEYLYGNQPSPYFPSPHNHQHIQQHIPVREIRQQSQSDLVIFNGEQPFRDLYHHDTSPKKNLAFVPPKIVKSPSQKAFPIIYNSLNNNQTEKTFPNYVQTNPIRYQPAQNDFHKNLSNISDKQQQQMMGRQHQLHTFHNFPTEKELQTAKFMHFPQSVSNDHNNYTSSQVDSYRPTYFQQRQPQNVQMHYQQMPVHSNTQPQGHFGNSGPQGVNKNTSRIVQQPFLNITSSASQPKRIAYQYAQQQASFPEEKLRVGHPNDEHHFLRQQQSRRLQQENAVLRGQVEELGRKERSSWQQSSHLREENQRLRELLHNFQARQKELLREKSDYKQAIQEQIIKYKESTLQQFALLLERYKLQLQKTK